MRYLIALALALVALGALAAACDDDGDGAVTPEGPTTLSLEKSVEKTDDAEVFAFTLVVTNEGENAAVKLITSDVWEEGFEMVEIDPVDGQEVESIAEIGLEFILEHLAPGESVTSTYRARCVATGAWENVAVSTAENADAAEASVGVACP